MIARAKQRCTDRSGRGAGHSFSCCWPPPSGRYRPSQPMSTLSSISRTRQSDPFRAISSPLPIAARSPVAG